MTGKKKTETKPAKMTEEKATSVNPLGQDKMTNVSGPGSNQLEQDQDKRAIVGPDIPVGQGNVEAQEAAAKTADNVDPQARKYHPDAPNQDVAAQDSELPKSVGPEGEVSDDRTFDGEHGKGKKSIYISSHNAEHTAESVWDEKRERTVTKKFVGGSVNDIPFRVECDKQVDVTEDVYSALKGLIEKQQGLDPELGEKNSLD